MELLQDENKLLKDEILKLKEENKYLKENQKNNSVKLYMFNFYIVILIIFVLYFGISFITNINKADIFKNSVNIEDKSGRILPNINNTKKIYNTSLISQNNENNNFKWNSLNINKNKNKNSWIKTTVLYNTDLKKII